MIALIGDGNGNIFVPDRPGYVYVRIQRGNNTQNAQARIDDKKFKPVYDAPITVGYDLIAEPVKQLFKVLSIYEVEK